MPGRTRAFSRAAAELLEADENGLPANWERITRGRRLAMKALGFAEEGHSSYLTEYLNRAEGKPAIAQEDREAAIGDGSGMAKLLDAISRVKK